MTLAHKIVLWGLLGLLGLSLLVPGLMNVARKDEGTVWLIAETVDAKNHLRALNAMMAALGLIALWACWDLERARLAVIGLGVGDGGAGRRQGLFDRRRRLAVDDDAGLSRGRGGDGDAVPGLAAAGLKACG
ncbi:MAG TPA: DUF4345 family protein [Rhodospirillales bacterium]